jgi:hypothetical protein
VRLSAAQKRDLVGQAVAAVITAALIAAPLVVPRETDALRATNTPIAAPLVTARVVAAAPAAVPGAPAPVGGAPAAIAGDPAAVAGPPTAVLVSLAAPSIARRERAVSALLVVQAEHAAPPVTAASTASAGRDAPRKALGRRFAVLLTGDGSHSVRPFPTVATTRH